LLDIGCGGGILSEPLMRLGARVVGADPSQTNIEAAKLHATAAGIAVDYRATTAEALADEGERFDLVLAMEVVEHVADLALFIGRSAEAATPGGLMITAPINRTLQSSHIAIRRPASALPSLPHTTSPTPTLPYPLDLPAE